MTTWGRLSLIAVFVLALFAPLHAAHADRIGVVLMHGKGGTSKLKSPVGQLKNALEDAGFLVVAPDMPWSRSRQFDRDFEASMAEIDEAVADLKDRGATRFVVGGHSIGANAALGYGARRDGLAGILAMAPGHIPEVGSWRSRFESAVSKARALIAEGKGDEFLTLTDINQGRELERNLKAKVIASWFAPDTGAVMPINAANLKPGTPLMWIIGKKDRMLSQGPEYAYDKAPAHPKSRYQVIGGGHKATPKKGKAEIIDWLKSL